MNDTSESSQGEQPTPKKLTLNIFLPAKEPVETSIGTLYVRQANSTDWKAFKIDDSQELGRVVVGVLCSRVEDNHDREPLAEEDLDALTKADFLTLVPVISRQSGWREIPAWADIKELGDVVKEAKEQETERHRKMLADMSKSLDSNYGFLGKSTLEKLQEQMAGLVDFRSAQSDTKVMRGIASPRTIDAMNIPMPLRPEDSTLGRATLESAKNSREVAQKMDALVNVVAGLNQTLVQDVLPEWFKKIEEDQKGAKYAFNQAANGLRWTKWAIIVSVIVTVLATWWQVEVARAIDLENAEQQKRSEAILREQLEAQQKMIEQQARDAAALRKTISVIKPPVPKK